MTWTALSQVQDMEVLSQMLMDNGGLFITAGGKRIFKCLKQSLSKGRVQKKNSILFKTHPPHPLLWNYFHHFHSMTKTPVDTLPWGSTPQCLMGALTACRGVTKSLRGANSPLGGLEVGAWENWQNGRHYQHGQNKVEFSTYGSDPPPLEVKNIF